MGIEVSRLREALYISITKERDYKNISAAIQEYNDEILTILNEAQREGKLRELLTHKCKAGDTLLLSDLKRRANILNGCGCIPGIASEVILNFVKDRALFHDIITSPENALLVATQNLLDDDNLGHYYWETYFRLLTHGSETDLQSVISSITASNTDSNLLMKAIRMGNEEFTLKILDCANRCDPQGSVIKQVLTKTDSQGHNPLHLSLLNFNLQVIKGLLEAAKNSGVLDVILSQEDNEGSNAIILATKVYNTSAIQPLNTVLNYAKLTNPTTLLKLLTHVDKRGRNALLIASPEARDYTDKVKAILGSVQSVNIKSGVQILLSDAISRTTLQRHLACLIEEAKKTHGEAELIEIIIKGLIGALGSNRNLTYDLIFQYIEPSKAFNTMIKKATEEAINLGTQNAIMVLIKKGEEKSVFSFPKDHIGFLKMALEKNSIEICSKILKVLPLNQDLIVCPVNDQSGDTLVHYAIKKNYLAILEQFLKMLPSDLLKKLCSQSNKAGELPLDALVKVADEHNKKLIESLIVLGIQEFKDPTVWKVIIDLGILQAANILSDQRIEDLLTPIDDKWTPLEYAISRHGEISHYMIWKLSVATIQSVQDDILESALFYGNAKSLRAIIGKLKDIEDIEDPICNKLAYTDNQGRNALHKLISSSKVSYAKRDLICIVSVMLERLSHDPLGKDIYGHTPLFKAIMSNDGTMALAILEAVSEDKPDYLDTLLDSPPAKVIPYLLQKSKETFHEFLKSVNAYYDSENEEEAGCLKLIYDILLSATRKSITYGTLDKTIGGKLIKLLESISAGSKSSDSYMEEFFKLCFEGCVIESQDAKRRDQQIYDQEISQLEQTRKKVKSHGRQISEELNNYPPLTQSSQIDVEKNS